jgi:hypothetical protein
MATSNEDLRGKPGTDSELYPLSPRERDGVRGKLKAGYGKNATTHD